jgi:phosphoribosylformylglycinamidine synthase II
MIFRIETFSKPDFPDPHGQQIKSDIEQLGIRTITIVQSIRVFLIEGQLDNPQLERIARELLADPISEDYFIGHADPPPGLAHANLFEVHLKPGVTDTIAASTLLAINDIKIHPTSIRTARKYILLGTLNEKQKQVIAKRVLGNDCIEEVIIGLDKETPSPHVNPYQLQLQNIPIRDLDDDQLQTLSQSRDLFLNLAEMRTIQSYYQKLDREPTDIELETLAQTWSEHCVHKTFRGIIEYTDYSNDHEKGETKIIENLLKTTIARATHELDKDWCISVFEDNAGIIEFDDDFGITVKVETHNHPSAIEPYGGAATGIGGCIRDTMGTGLAAKPIANTDIFCFAPPNKDIDSLPAGVLHPRRVMKGVVSGVRDYGNRMGIPTVNGAIQFDDRYLGNPLVFCGSVGIIPRDKCFGDAQPGNLIMVIGGRTGRDGIHGATFSSGEMTHEHEDLFSHAVQIGNPIVEKKMLDTLLQARDENLYVAITDCGAGGLSSAVGEMGEKVGAVVHLEKVPLKYDGLNYTEIWISEAQERMVIALPPENLVRAQEIFDAEDVEAVVIGEFGNDARLDLFYNNQSVGSLDMEFLHNGLPKYTRKATWHDRSTPEPNLTEKSDYTNDLLAILSHYNVASKEWVIRQYDHEVQGASVIKPLVGVNNDGPGDAAVIRPRLDSDQGIAIGCGICPQFGDIDPYWMTLAAIDEAVRNVVAVGGRADRIAILDNFCWGNCDKPDRLGGLVRSAQGCYDAAIAFGTPFISGKDSLNNEFKTESGETINIPGTLLVSSVTLVDDIHQCVTMDLKKTDNLLLIIGETKNELGASHYYIINNELGSNVPKVNLKTAPNVVAAIAQAISDELILSCHDCSEGGLAVALAEMAFAGNLGININLAGVPLAGKITRNDQILFSESTTRFIVEIAPENFDRFAKLCQSIRFGQIGTSTRAPILTIKDRNNKTIIDTPVDQCKEAWQKPLNW